GGLDLSMSDLGSLLIAGGCSLRADSHTALDLAHAEFRSGLTLEPGVEICGTMRLTGAHIRGDVSLKGVWLRSPQRAGPTPDAAEQIHQPFQPSGSERSQVEMGYAIGLEAAHAQVAGTLDWSPAAPVNGVVSLRGAAAGELADDWRDKRGNAYWPVNGR